MSLHSYPLHLYKKSKPPYQPAAWLAFCNHFTCCPKPTIKLSICASGVSPPRLMRMAARADSASTLIAINTRDCQLNRIGQTFRMAGKHADLRVTEQPCFQTIARAAGVRRIQPCTHGSTKLVGTGWIARHAGQTFRHGIQYTGIQRRTGVVIQIQFHWDNRTGSGGIGGPTCWRQTDRDTLPRSIFVCRLLCAPLLH